MLITTLAFLRHLAFGAGLALFSALVVRGMIAVRMMDTPDARKAHDRPTPKGGGVGIVAAFIAGIVGLYAFAAFARLGDTYFLGVIGAAITIAAVALADDRYDWPFTVKLGAQVAAALVAIMTGLFLWDIRVPWIGVVEIGWAGIVVTLLWVVFTTNAMNFIDGLNGLASGVTFIACAFLGWIALREGSWFAYAMAGMLAAGIAGFLPFNFPRARIFMGDVGSQFCGFMLAQLAVVASRFDGVELSFLLVPMMLAGVLYDVTFTLVRRGWQGKRVTQPHRGHLYQIAHRSGVSPVMVTLAHWSFAAIGGVASLLFVEAPSGVKPFIPLLVVVPQVVWTVFVVRRARAAGIGDWG